MSSCKKIESLSRVVKYIWARLLKLSNLCTLEISQEYDEK
jgi:hypothetical protein